MLESLLEKSNFVKLQLLLQSAERIMILLKATLFCYPVGPQKTYEIFGSKSGLRKEILSFKSEMSIFVLYLSIFMNIFLFEKKNQFLMEKFLNFFVGQQDSRIKLPLRVSTLCMNQVNKIAWV